MLTTTHPSYARSHSSTETDLASSGPGIVSAEGTLICEVDGAAFVAGGTCYTSKVSIEPVGGCFCLEFAWCKDRRFGCISSIQATLVAEQALDILPGAKRFFIP